VSLSLTQPYKINLMFVSTYIIYFSLISSRCSLFNQYWHISFSV